ncbi:hypothetical protein LZ30DRAFT_692738 [Colletotrichum cereale]|nr:hypothetical protein LZ30DRAFT_692738 [Colletotrichum cereale]
MTPSGLTHLETTRTQRSTANRKFGAKRSRRWARVPAISVLFSSGDASVLMVEPAPAALDLLDSMGARRCFPRGLPWSIQCRLDETKVSRQGLTARQKRFPTSHRPLASDMHPLQTGAARLCRLGNSSSYVSTHSRPHATHSPSSPPKDQDCAAPKSEGRRCTASVAMLPTARQGYQGLQTNYDVG